MINIIKFQYKLLFAEKTTLIYMGCIYILCVTVVPLYWQERFFSLVGILSLNFIVQIGPRLFVGEKENDTLETLISTPYEVETIFMGKTLFCFSVLCIMFYLSVGGTAFLSLFCGLNIFEGTWKEILLIIALIPLAFFIASYHAASISLKTDDSKVCAVKLIGIMILYAVLINCVLIILTTPSLITSVTVILFYIVIMIGVLFILYNRNRKILKKSIVFSCMGRVS